MLNVPRPAKFLGFYPDERLATRFERVRSQLYGPQRVGKKDVGKTKLLKRAVTEMLDRLDRRKPTKHGGDAGTALLAAQLAKLPLPVQKTLRDLLDGLTLLQAKKAQQQRARRRKDSSSAPAADSQGTGSWTAAEPRLPATPRGKE